MDLGPIHLMHVLLIFLVILNVLLSCQTEIDFEIYSDSEYNAQNPK